MNNQWLQEFSKSGYAIAVNMLQCRDEAYDVLQDACYSVLKQKSSPTEKNQFRAWFYTTIRNKVIDRMRSKKIRKASEFDEGVHESEPNDEPETYWVKTQQNQQLHQALSQLSFEQKEILLLKDWQGFSYAEIAKILNVESGTVMSRLHRARLALREHFLQQEENSK